MSPRLAEMPWVAAKAATHDDHQGARSRFAFTGVSVAEAT